MNRILALLGFSTFAAFIGILLWKVPEPDLIIVCALTVALVAYDFFTSSNRSG